MRPVSLPFVGLCVIGLFGFASLAHAQKGRTTPGLVIETGARTATCDQLLFDPTGSYLLAVGEDKVLRRWPVGAEGFLQAQSLNVRWSIQREARGSIFTAAFDRTGQRVAFAGFGVQTGLVATARLGGETPQIESVCEPVPSPETNWAVAFSPDGRFVYYGNDIGEVYRWEPGSKVRPTLFTASRAKSRTTNPVRLLSFIDERSFVTVTADGAVRLWNATDPDIDAPLQHTFRGGSVFRAVLGFDASTIAVGLTPNAATAGTVAGAEAVNRVHLFNLKTKTPTTIALPATGAGTRAVRALAFDRNGDQLAVGCNETPKLEREDFLRLKNGVIFIYNPAKPEKPTVTPITLGYNVEALAFHPVRSNLLASAGGDNHELALWNTRTGTTLSTTAEVRGPANGVWGVSFDAKGWYFAWKDRRDSTPKHPNHLATGPWRVFDLTGRQILASAPADFRPVSALDRVDGWEVKPTTSSAVWRVVGPGGVDARLDDASGLYNRLYNQEPRCWTFVKSTGKPLRLAVGHQWGVSVYECRPTGVKLVRVMTGHEGQVMCIAPSADGELLITGSRDQTVCLWSLASWKAENEMGAKFEVRGGKLVVADVDAGSPAWEPLNPLDGTDRDMNRLAKGDTIDLLYIVKDDFVFDPLDRFETERAKGRLLPVKTRTRNATEAANRLNTISPAKEYILAKQREGVPDLIYKLTTCRQRPLLRFFATRSDLEGAGREWVIWRPRDYFYDTSAHGDRYVGWHVNAVRPDQPPAFYPLERYRGSDHVPGAGKDEPSGFHRPDKIWPFVMKAFQDPTNIIFTEMEPPRVTLQFVQLPNGSRPLGAAKVAVGPDVVIQVGIESVEPSQADQLLKHINVFVNDHKDQRAKLAPSLLGQFKPATIRLSSSELLWGRNVVKVDCVNGRGGRGEAVLRFDYEPPDRPTATLYALIVGINDYSKAKGYGDGVSNLQCSKTDAEEVARVVQQHEASRNFAKAFPILVPEEKATAGTILARIEEIGRKVKPNDHFVVYLAGHGDTQLITGVDGKQYARPGSYFYVTCDCDVKKPDTLLTSQKLYDALMKINCRKMLVLDTCHSGAAAKDAQRSASLGAGDQLRDMTREGKTLLVLSSCQEQQRALEPAEPDSEFRHGFFTHALLNVIGNAEKGKGKPRRVPVTFGELEIKIGHELETLLKRIGAEKEKWHQPAFSPPDPSSQSVLSRPLP